MQVDEDLIAAVLSVMTGIPMVKLAEEETQKLLRMEDELRKRAGRPGRGGGRGVARGAPQPGRTA